MQDILRKGHEFQEERSRGLTPEMLKRVPRNIDRIAQSVYQGQSPALSVYEQAQQASDPNLVALRRQATFYQQTIAYTTTARLILPASNRTYIFIQNLDAAADLYLGFGVRPAVNQGIRIAAGIAYEPFQIPQNDVWMIGSAGGNAVFIYGN